MRTLPESAAGGGPPVAGALPEWVDWRERHDRPLYSARLWPNRAMGPFGHRLVLALAGIVFAVPLVISAPGKVALGLLPFLGGALWALGYALRRNWREGRATEERVAIWRDEMRVERRDPDGRIRRWQADPWQVRIALRKDGPVEQYLTLKGGGREIELGAFLSPEERVALAAELEQALTRAIRA